MSEPALMVAPVDGVASAKSPSLIAAVGRASDLLRAKLTEFKVAGTAEQKVKSEPVTAEVILAVWNRDTDVIDLIEATKQGVKLKPKSPLPFPIKVTLSSGVYSRYSLPSESRQIVVGVLYPLSTKLSKSSFNVKYVVYTPYSKDFFTPEVLAAGSDYLSFQIKTALDILREKNVKSRAFPDRLVSDVIDPYLVKSVVVIEHTSHKPLLGDAPEGALGSFLVSLATNRDDAFDLDISRAGAVGLVQFIPSTYKLMVDKRKDLGLISDFKAGMADHLNAFKAQVAYLDMVLADMPKEIREQYLTRPDLVSEYMAAGYNGGSTRVRRAVQVWGPEWSVSQWKKYAALQSRVKALKPQLKKLKAQGTKESKKKLAALQSEHDQAIVDIATINKSALRDETVIYVAKLRKTYDMFAAGAYATPNAPSGALPESNQSAQIDNSAEKS